MQERGFCGSGDGVPTPSPEAGGGPNLLGTPAGSGLAQAQGGRGRNASAAAMEDILGGSKEASVDAHSAAGAEGMAGGEETARERGLVEAPRKTIDVILHSVAHAPTDAMRQGFIMVRPIG